MSQQGCVPWPTDGQHQIPFNAVPPAAVTTPAVSGNGQGNSGRTTKMPISRLGPGGRISAPKRTIRSHTSRACEQCRQRKTKCSGDRPTCKSCVTNQAPCAYTDGKREQLRITLEKYRKALNSMSKRLGEPPEELLETLVREYDEQEVLEKAQGKTTGEANHEKPKQEDPHSQEQNTPGSSTGTNSVSVTPPSVPSNQALDLSDSQALELLPDSQQHLYPMSLGGMDFYPPTFAGASFCSEEPYSSFASDALADAMRS
ncbi:hypothetical protein BDW62DRAFT_193721 [Aspergillus aurantiobrunneus]